MTKSPSVVLASIPARMIDQLAFGMEDPDDIAARWGYAGQEWEAIRENPILLKAVQRRRAEFEANGVGFVNKAKLMAEELLDNTYKAAIQDTTPVKDKAAALQLLSRLGDLEPKTQVQAQGSGFSISINVPAAPSSLESISTSKEEVIDAKVVEPEVSAISLAFTEFSTKPAEPPKLVSNKEGEVPPPDLLEED